MGDSCVLAWLFARSPERSRICEGRGNLPAEACFTQFVKAELVAGGVVADLDQAADAPDWQARLARLHAHVVGLVLLRPLFIPDTLSVLSRAQRAVSDFWHVTKYKHCQLLFVEAIEVTRFDPPEVVNINLQQQLPRSLFACLSYWSAHRLQQRAHQSIANWVARHNLQEDALRERSSKTSLVMALPTPHAMLLAHGRWSSWAFPVARGRVAGGLGIRLARPLMLPFAADIVGPGGGDDDDGEPAENQNVFDGFAPETLQDLADLLRQGLQEGPNELAQKYVRWLQDRRRFMLESELLRTRRAYRLTHLVMCLIYAGFLKNASHLLQSLRFAVAVAVSDDALRDHLLNCINQPHSIPSRTAVRRHRLTCHMGWCLWQQSLNEAMLAESGITQWSTVDSSPQGAYDWVLHGSRKMRNSDLLPAMDDANVLCNQNMAPEARKAAADRLSSKLGIILGVPTAVGSGRSSLIRKIHAVVHSTRLVSTSWRMAARLMCSTFSWTGDLGVESGMWTFNKPLSQVFGAWPAQADQEAGEDDGEEQGDQEHDDAFDFVAEQEEQPMEFDFLDGEPDVAAEDNLDDHRHDGQEFSDDAYQLDLRKSLFVAGVLHVMHNTTRDLGEQLTHWSEYIEQLRQVSRLLKYKWSRSRLLQTCFANGPQAARKHEISGFNGAVYEGRWGGVFFMPSASCFLCSSCCAMHGIAKSSLQGVVKTKGMKSQSSLTLPTKRSAAIYSGVTLSC